MSAAAVGGEHRGERDEINNRRGCGRVLSSWAPRRHVMEAY
jgi:hypothetical protein